MSILLPAGGRWREADSEYAGQYGSYWATKFSNSSPLYIILGASTLYISANSQFIGTSVRAITF